MEQEEQNILQKLDSTKRKSLARQKRMEDLIESNQLGIMDYIHTRLRRMEERDDIYSLMALKLREKLENGDEFEITAQLLIQGMTAIDRNASEDLSHFVQLIKADPNSQAKDPPDPSIEEQEKYTKKLEGMTKEEKNGLKKFYEIFKAFQHAEQGENNNNEIPIN